jgi:predicted site-specific integrase-resolvase
MIATLLAVARLQAALFLMIKLLTSEEAATALRVPVKTLHKWRREGTGPPGVKMGLRVVYREADLEDWVNSQFDGESDR